MYFAAKAAAERQARQRAERLREETRKEERAWIVKVLEEQGVPLTPEQAKALDRGRERV